MNGIGFGNEFKVYDDDGVLRWALRFQEDGDIELVRFNSSGVEQETVLEVDGATGAITADIAAGEVATADLADSAVTPVKVAASHLAPAADAAVAITSTTTHIALNSTTGTKVISTTSSAPGQVISLRADVVSGGAYTLVVLGGTLTLNSAGEAAVIKRVGTDWVVLALTPSSSTAANIATIV